MTRGLEQQDRAPARPEQLRRSSEIDSLRCIAMTAVIAQHCGLLPLGWTGVWLFYAISGYVVTQSMIGREVRATPGERLRHFYWRRLIRIVPIYYLYCLSGVAITMLSGVTQDPLAIASLLGFFNNWAMIVGRGELTSWSVGYLWTVSTEMQFYCVYGIALCLAPRRFLIGLLGTFLVFAPVARLIVSIWCMDSGWAPLDQAYAIYAGPGLHADVFAMGALLAVVSQRWSVTSFARPLFLAGAAALCAYSLAYVLVNHLVLGQGGVNAIRNVVSGILAGQYREVSLYSAVGLFSTGCIALAAARDPWVRWLLNNRAFGWIGVVSYGGYVYHGLVLHLIGQLLPLSGWGPLQSGVVAGLLQFGLSYPIILILAGLSFRYLETPLLRMASSGVGRKRPAV